MVGATPRRSYSQWLVLLFISAVPAQAQTQWRFGVEADNDFFVNFDPNGVTDYEYTHGTRIWAESETLDILPRVLPGVIGCGEQSAACRHRITIGQELYTPRRDARPPLSGQRPHAAWLYASFETHLIRGSVTTVVDAGIGMLGPPAFGAEVQTAVHSLFGSRIHRGWDDQLPFEPTLQVGIERIAHLVEAQGDVTSLAAGYEVAGDVGNALTQGRAGVRARICVGEGSCPVAFTNRVARLGLSVGGRAGSRLVLRNAFLDGTIRESRSVEKERWVPYAAAALGIRLRSVVVEYERTWRSAEYHSEPGGFSFASVRINYLW